MSTRIKQAGRLIVLSHIFSQGIRLLANLAVARLLAPEMFGVMALTLVIQQGILMFSDVGLNAYVIRHKDYKNQNILNTVWTIQVIRGWVLFLTLLSISAGLWMIQQHGWTVGLGSLNNSQLPLMMAVVSITAIMKGYNSLAPLVYGRELQRKEIEISQLLSQFFGTVVMVVWAWFSPNVWALASAGIVSTIFSLFFSYYLFNIRHEIQWDRVIAIDVYHFGKWIFIATALTYLSQQGDRLFLSANVSETQLGLYSIAVILSGFAINFINKITDQLWLPVFSNNAADILQLKKQYYKIRLIQDAVVGGFVLLTVAFSPLVISIIYDERYTDVTGMLQLLIMLVIPVSISSSNQALLVAIGETKVQMQVMLVKALALIIMLPTLFTYFHLEGVIIAVVISAFLAIIPQYVKMKKCKVLNLLGEMKVLLSIIILYVILISFKLFIGPI